MEEAIKGLLKNLEYKDEDIAHFSKKGYEGIVLSKTNFHNITNQDSGRKIAFLDGGNQEIAGSHNFSLQLIRIYYCIYQDNKRVDKGTYEAYALITTARKEDSLAYNASFFVKDKSIKIDDFSFDAYDASLSTGQRMVKVETIGDTVRKFFELTLAKDLCEKISGGIIVLDTTLEATVSGERTLFDSLYDNAKKNDVIISALSKTTSLLTKNGNSVIAVLSQMAPDSKWYYHPLAKITSEDHKADIYLVKLHERSRYIFRLEIHDGSKEHAHELISSLSSNSKDPVFLGYPYGMIDADKNARVQNREVEVRRTQLFVKLGKDFDKIRTYINTKNAHDILDNIG